MLEDGGIADTALMVRVRDGDQRAFEVLHGRYQRRVMAFFYGMAGERSAASDLCQETFLRVWKIRRRYRATGPFAGYLFSIARMIWLENRRAWRKAPPTFAREDLDTMAERPVGAETGPDACAVRSEISGHVFAAMEELPEEQRMVFVLRTLRGLSLEDIAATLDCPLNTVRSRKLLAIKKMRQALAGIFACSADRVL